MYFFRLPEGRASVALDGISSGDEFSLEPVKKNSSAVVFLSQLDQMQLTLPARGKGRVT